MLIGRRNYLRIVHTGFVCRNGGLRVLFRAADTTFRDKVDVWSVVQSVGRRERTTGEKNKGEKNLCKREGEKLRGKGVKGLREIMNDLVRLILRPRVDLENRRFLPSPALALTRELI